MPEDGALSQMPAGLGYDEAAAVPYGAVTALIFLRDLGKLRRGQRMLIVGASGGVGRFAVQLGKHFGAEVTGVCSSQNVDLVRALGADHVIDYTTEDFTRNGQRYDIIFDTAGVTSVARCKASLTREGRHLFLHVGLSVLLNMLVTSVTGGRRALFGVAFGSREDMDQVRLLLEQGAIRPVIDRRYPLARIAEAHARVESRRPRGSVVLTIASAHMAAK